MIDSNKQIKLGAFLSYFAIFFNIIAGLLYTPWMISKIGKADYGLYMLVTSFLTYFIVDFGLWQAISRYITKYRAGRQRNEVPEYYWIVGKDIFGFGYYCLHYFIYSLFFSGPDIRKTYTRGTG